MFTYMYQCTIVVLNNSRKCSIHVIGVLLRAARDLLLAGNHAHISGLPLELKSPLCSCTDHDLNTSHLYLCCDSILVFLCFFKYFDYQIFQQGVDYRWATLIMD